MSIVDEVSNILLKNDKIKDKKKTVKIKLSKKEIQIMELANNTVMPENFKVVWTEDDLENMCKFLEDKEYIAVDTETMGIIPFTDEIVGFSVYAPDKGFYIPLKHKDDIGEVNVDNGVVGIDYVKCLSKDKVIQNIKPIFEDRNKKFIFHNAKFDMLVLDIWLNIDIKPYFDTLIAQWLLDENQSKALKDIAPIYLKVEADKFNTLFGNVTFNKVPILLNKTTRTGCLAGYYAIKDTLLTYKMFEFQYSYLIKPQFKDLYNLMFNIEMPFISIVKDAEMKGIKFDLDYMQKEVSPKLMGEYEDLKKKIFKYTGEINLNSPLQVSKVLYDELKLPIIDKKKGKSTDKKTLQKLKNYHECIPLLLEYRSLSKLIDSFVDKLPKSVIDGRIHPNFRTIGCVTGRMSCSNPNLQQMPSHNNMIRKAFVADEGRLLVSIDFSGQELRILTHITKDPLLLDLYKNNGDVHAMTGVAIYNKMYSKNITYEYFQYCRSLQEYFLDREGNLDSNKLKDDNIKELFSKQIINTLDKNKIEEDVKNGIEFEKVRKNYAKMVNFGVIYGITENGLSNDLNITEKEAKQFIDSFYSTYKGVAKWVNDTKKQVLEKGYVTTLCGRKRRFYPYLTSGERWKVETAFRMACNSQIQGSATDQIKIASIKLQPLLKELDAHIVLFIHDEIIFDVPENIGMKNLQRIADVMCNALVLDCGMKSDIEVGRKWSEKLTLDEINELEVK